MNGGIGPRDPSKSIQIPTSLRRHAKVSCFVSAKPWQSRGSQGGPCSCSYFSLITLTWMFRHPVYSIQPCSACLAVTEKHMIPMQALPSPHSFRSFSGFRHTGVAFQHENPAKGCSWLLSGFVPQLQVGGLGQRKTRSWTCWTHQVPRRPKLSHLRYQGFMPLKAEGSGRNRRQRPRVGPRLRG